MTLMQRFPRLAKVRDRWSRAAIILYHRVIAIDSDPWGLAVSPDHFARQMEHFKRCKTVLSTIEFCELMRRDALPRNAVAITFDDGYYDNYLNASPILEATGLPATLFLCTGPTRRQEPYWFEELAGIVLEAVTPAKFTIVMDDGPLLVSFGPRCKADDCRIGWRAWHEPRTEREALFCTMWTRLRRMSPSDRDATMSALRTQLSAGSRERDRPMTVDETRSLTMSGLFTLGAHTVDHPDLTNLSSDQALDQIIRSKVHTEAIVGSPIYGFAYPYGRFDERVKALVVEAGFHWACTTEPGFIGASRSDLLKLPRIVAADVDDIVFAQ